MSRSASQPASRSATPPTPTRAVENPSSRSAWKWVPVGLSIGVLVLLLHLLDAQRWLPAILDRMEGLGALAPVLFIAIYCLAAVLLIPGSILTLGAGAVFGVVRGAVVVSIASTLGAAAAFLVGRYLARESIQRRLGSNARFVAIDEAVGEQGWKIVLLTRLSPVFPYTVLNYLFGLTRVKLGPFVLASWLGMIPGTILYVYLGSLVQVADSTQRTAAEWVLYGVGLLATIVVTLFVTRLARRALNRQMRIDNGA